MKEIYVYASTHSEERMKERIGIKNAKEMRRMMQLAFERGKRSNDIRRTEFRSYISGKCALGCEAVVYNDHCFIFNPENGVCVTVYDLPQRFTRQTFGRSMSHRRDREWEEAV